jgi:foldase protein PrsA
MSSEIEAEKVEAAAEAVAPPPDPVETAEIPAPARAVVPAAGPVAKPKKGPNLIVIVLIAFLLGWGANALRNRSRENAALLIVNGEPITRRDLLHRCEVAAGTPVMRQLKNERLQLQFAKQQGVLPSENEVESRYVHTSQQPDFQQKLAASHETPEDIRKGILLGLIQQALITKNVSVSDAEVADFYRRNTDKTNPKARYYQPESVTIAIIVSDREDDIKSAREELAKGASFASVVAKYSKDPNTKPNNGQLGPIRRGQLNAVRFPGLEEKLFAMKTGEQIGPIQAGSAWWLVRCLDKKDEVILPFERVKEDCRTEARLEKGRQVNGQSLQAAAGLFEKNANIQVLDPQYKEAATINTGNAPQTK